MINTISQWKEMKEVHNRRKFNIDDFKDKYNDPDDAVDYGEEMKDYDEFMSEVEMEEYDEGDDESSDNSEELE